MTSGVVTLFLVIPFSALFMLTIVSCGYALAGNSYGRVTFVVSALALVAFFAMTYGAAAG